MSIRAISGAIVAALLGVACLSNLARAEPSVAPTMIRAGIIGLDTSHVVAFTKIFNDPKASGDLAGIRVVAAYPGGSPDLAASRDRVDGFTKQIRGMGVEVVDSIPTLLAKVDVVLLESVDGRPHLRQARLVFEAQKPVFIDKPLAGSLADAIAIAQLAQSHHVSWFSSSALRFAPKLQAPLRDPAVGPVIGCDAWGPCPIEPTHPDLFWYGIHGVEMLYTVMGRGCQTVTRVHTDGADCVVGQWKDGRIGTFRGIRQGKEDYGAVVFGSKKVATVVGFEGYGPLVEQIGAFFRTGKPPVSADETIELLAFMEAADETKRQGGRPVELKSVMEHAQRQAQSELDDLK